MRLERLPLKSLDLRSIAAVSSLIENAPRRSFVPPSLVPETPVAAPETPAPPALTEADVQRAAQEAYRKGFLEGEREGRAQGDAAQAEQAEKLTAALETVSAQAQELLAQYNAAVAEQQALTPRLALAIAHKVAGRALDQNALAVVEPLAMETLKAVMGEPTIYITVHESLAAELEERLITHFAGNNEPGEIHIEGDAGLGIADCRVRWGTGSAERNTEALWNRVHALIDDMTAAPPAAAPSPLANEGE